MKTTRRIPAICTASALLALAAAPVASSATRHDMRPPKAVTGNPAVIAFYRKVVQATRAADAERMTFAAAGSLMQVKLDGGGKYSWYQYYPAEPGYAPAAGVIWVGATAGRVRFVAETVTYGGVGTEFGPFGIVLTPRGEVMLSGGANPSSSPGFGAQPCLGPTTGAPYVGGYSRTAGPSGYGLYGHFLSMRRSGGTVAVTSTYPWGKAGQHATEVDTISATTYLPSRSVIHVSTVPGAAGFTAAYTATWYHTPIAPPNSTGVCTTYLKSVS